MNDAPNTAVLTSPAIDFAENELAGILLETCVRQLEGLQTPWSMTSEANQMIHINKMRENITKAVKDAVLVIATQRHPAIKATVKSVNFDDGIKATLTLNRHETGRHDLADSTGSTVLIILTDAESFLGGTEKVKGAPDQPELPLVDGETSGEAGAGTIPESLPEIRENDDGTFTVYKDQMPVAGGKGFASHADAETWLQKTLGIEKKSAPAGEPVVPVRDEAAEKKRVDDAVKAFKATGKTEAMKDVADWDTGWDAIAGKYDDNFVEEHYDVLSKAYADGFEAGQA